MKTFINNIKYILTTSLKIFTYFFTGISFLSLITPIDIFLSHINNNIFRFIVACSILLLIYLTIIIFVTLYAYRTKQVKVFDLNSNHSLYVEYGDLFENNRNEQKNIAFAGNRCFDTIVDDDLVGSKKIHGMALNRLYAAKKTSKSVSKEIQRDLSLHNYKCEKINKTKKRKGNLIRYEVGSVAEINGLDKERYFILGLTYFDSELRAQVKKEEYFTAIGKLLRYISKRSQGFPTYMPIIGSGGSDVGTPSELLTYLIEAISFYKDIINCDIHIVVYSKERNIGILNTKLRRT